MKEMDDGRFSKVANIIGQAMQYHPHGDASIGDALVNMGQKIYSLKHKVIGEILEQVMMQLLLVTLKQD
jgi:DNA gyrase/topoisomerase IV subunit A